MKRFIKKLIDWRSNIMNGNYERRIQKIIHETLIDDFNKRKSCICNVFIFYDKEKRQIMLTQIASKQDIQLTNWEVLTIINETANKIRNENPTAYPIEKASDTQIQEFVNAISDKSAFYFSAKHSNIINLSTQEVPDTVRDYLNNKELPNVKFTINDSNLQINLTSSGPLVHGSDNTETNRINNLIQTIFGVGILLEFFDINPLNRKVFNLKEATFNHVEDYITLTNLFSTETENLAEKISMGPIAHENVAKYFTTLHKILNNVSNADAVMYSLSWYCKSLDFADIKTIFICRYIGFEALSGIWTKTNKNDKSSQDKVKYTIAALLAEDVNDLKNKQDLLKDIISLRNELFHGNKNEGSTEEFGRKMSQSYAHLGFLYKDLFLYTVNRI